MVESAVLSGTLNGVALSIFASDSGIMARSDFKANSKENI